MTTKISVQEVVDLLNANNDILILCHKSPDGDTLGSAAALCYALKGLGKNVSVACHNEIPGKYDYLKIPVYDKSYEPKFVVSVDVASAKLLGDNLSEYAENVDLCIDHHASNSSYSKFLCLADYPAAAQLMFEILTVMGCEMTKHIVNCLYTGLITDTGCFKYSSTTPETLKTGAKLMEMGADHTFLVEKFFMSKTKKAVLLEKYAYNNIEYYFDGKCALLFLTEEALDEIQPEPTDIDGISSLARNFEGVEVSVLIRPSGEENVYKISVRTGETADACEIAAGLGGGGHKRASGCEVTGVAEKVKKAILMEVENELCK